MNHLTADESLAVGASVQTISSNRQGKILRWDPSSNMYFLRFENDTESWVVAKDIQGPFCCEWCGNYFSNVLEQLMAPEGPSGEPIHYACKAQLDLSIEED